MTQADNDHGRLDERSLALHRLVARKVLADPALLDKARENVRRWQEAGGSASPALAEWGQILGFPVDQVARFLAERSERAIRLRQSSPFPGILTEAERRAIYDCTQLEHIIRAASQISGDTEIVVIGSQAIQAQDMKLPPIVSQSVEADVYPRNYPERAEDIDAAIGELSPFHETYGYYAHGVSPKTAVLPSGWERRLIRLSNSNTGGATGLCLDAHDLVLSKYAAGRERDRNFNQALVRHGCVRKRKLLGLVPSMPVDDELKGIILARIKSDFAASDRRPASKSPER